MKACSFFGHRKVEITEVETKDIITVSGIFESVDMLNVIGYGIIEMDLQ